MKKFTIFLPGVIITLIITLAGCSKSEEQPVPKPQFTTQGPEQIELDTIYPENIINGFAIVSDDSIATVEFPYFGSDGHPAFRKYENGVMTLEREFHEEDAYNALAYDKVRGSYYVYSDISKAIYSLDENFENASTLISFDSSAEIGIRNMEILGDKLYVLHTNKNPYDPDTVRAENNYADFAEQVKVIDPDSGKIEALDIPNPICFFCDGNDLFFYTCEKGKNYALRLFDIEKKTLTTLYDMDDVGYISSFVLYGNKFIYGKGTDNGFFQKNLETDVITSFANSDYVMNGMDMRLYKGNLIFADRNDMKIRKMFMGEVEASGGGQADFSGKELVISGNAQYNNVNISAIRDATGISATIHSFPIYEDEMLLKIMAGDSDIDIYTLYSTRSVGRSVRKNGIYVPLNDCGAVTDFLSDCHDYISDYAKAENGDIWALPITSDSEVVFYVPENIEKLGLNYKDDFMMYSDFIDTMRFMVTQNEFAHYGNPISGFTVELQSNYELNYGYKYNSDIFKNCFKATWEGWSRIEQEEHPCPYFRNYWNVGGSNFDTERIAFKVDYISRQMTGEDPFNYGDKPDPFFKWRAFPMPRLASKDEKATAYISYLVINPYGKNIEAAKHYLNTIASDNQKYIRGFNPLFKDIEAYADNYDINEPLLRDVYEISLDLAVSEPIVKTDAMEYIDDYQQGKMTLDEVAKYLERQAEIALNE